MHVLNDSTYDETLDNGYYRSLRPKSNKRWSMSFANPEQYKKTCAVDGISKKAMNLMDSEMEFDNYYADSYFDFDQTGEFFGARGMRTKKTFSLCSTSLPSELDHTEAKELYTPPSASAETPCIKFMPSPLLDSAGLFSIAELRNDTNYSSSYGCFTEAPVESPTQHLSQHTVIPTNPPPAIHHAKEDQLSLVDEQTVKSTHDEIFCARCQDMQKPIKPEPIASGSLDQKAPQTNRIIPSLPKDKFAFDNVGMPVVSENSLKSCKRNFKVFDAEIKTLPSSHPKPVVRVTGSRFTKKCVHPSKYTPLEISDKCPPLYLKAPLYLIPELRDLGMVPSFD